MDLIKWDESFSVNVAEIDTQHMKLMDLINQLFDAMSLGKGRDVLGSILTELANYTVTHFGFEEKKFAEFNYAETESHKSKHQAFVDKVVEFKGKFESGDVTISVALLDFLRDWLTEHIKGTDKKYTNCFNEHELV
tara:strand:+ start:1001 stop:1408 length:408 start_codon:yes stop_codon:yes gene_type:complete